MPSDRYRFQDFELDPSERTLTRRGEAVALNARYFDALVLLVRESGSRVSRERFFKAVWHDVVVGDAALTQAVKTIRQALGDDAAQPRFVETVPRYGYRFIADVHAAAPLSAVQPPAPASAGSAAPAAAVAPEAEPSDGALRVLGPAAGAVRGALGGALAGLGGGLIYGAVAAWSAPERGLSFVVALTAVNVLVGLLGGLGIGAGVASAVAARRASPVLRAAGAVLGGLLVGAVAQAAGHEGLQVLFGRAPARMTGALEGAVIGAAVWAGAEAAARWRNRARWAAPTQAAAGGAAVTALAAALLVLLGGELMGGSLDALGQTFAGSHVSLDAAGALFGEATFGRAARVATAATEGALFGGALGGALHPWFAPRQATAPVS